MSVTVGTVCAPCPECGAELPAVVTCVLVWCDGRAYHDCRTDTTDRWAHQLTHESEREKK